MNSKYIKLIAFLLICINSIFTTLSYIAFSEGEGNIDGGGSGMGNGTNQNYWNPGDDGVRVSIIRVSDGVQVTLSFDISNLSPDSSIISFEKQSKIQYRNGGILNQKARGYISLKPAQVLPQIISSSGNANIPAIKSYFTDEQVIRRIANQTGFDYNTLINGNYKLLLEPIAYFTFLGQKVGMTATEAALYDQQLDGGLRSRMVSLSHKNLPLAMFLEKSDLGYLAWTGSTNSPAADADIIASLGLGIVRFNENITPVPVSTYDYEYRVNTDVITAITVRAGNRVTPNNPATVVFTVNGGTYTVTNIVIPEGESQLVWFKWRTPNSPQNISVNVTSYGVSANKSVINAKIVKLDDNVPPNPKATDRNDGFVVPNIPNEIQKPSTSWWVWSAWWRSDWRWVTVWNWYYQYSWISDGKGGGYWYYWGYWVDNGYWKDYGDWMYYWTGYYASLSAYCVVSPDSKVPSSAGKTIKSGYGINIDVPTGIVSNAPFSHITGVQNVVAYFPEFRYQTYWRLLEMTTGGYWAQFKLKNNEFSTYYQRVHFTPVWYPNSRYTIISRIVDAWTPTGMLSVSLTDYVDIYGSVFDDWHIAPKSF